jgi:hypothetical protein
MPFFGQGTGQRSSAFETSHAFTDGHGTVFLDV